TVAEPERQTSRLIVWSEEEGEYEFQNSYGVLEI
ncbi:hypothetical protein Tco_1027920, partial [Tanacetum coccineum]